MCVGAHLLVTCIYVGDIYMLIISVDDFISLLPDYYKVLRVGYLSIYDLYRLNGNGSVCSHLKNIIRNFKRCFIFKVIYPLP